MTSVSALMVTQPGREAMARKALADFFDQDWDGPKEAVVVSDDVACLDRVIDGFRSSIVRVPALPGQSLGKLRNVALAMASHAVLVQWDDDDRYPPGRLAAQVGPLEADPGLACSCLTSQLYYFANSRDLYLVDWRNRRPRFKSILIPGTIAVRRAVALRCGYPDLARAEDGPFLEAVLAHGPAAEVDDPRAYVRIFHGKNTWEEGRFRSNAVAFSPPAAAVHAARAGLAALLRSFPFAGPGRVYVRGRDGAAFVHDVPA